MDSFASHKTHSKLAYLTETKMLADEIKARLRNSNSLILPLERNLELVDQLTEFELGRFLLHNRGLNGYWTSYIFQHPAGKPAEHVLEDWLLNRSLLCRARERYYRYQTLLAELITQAETLASIPCGVMDDLLDLDYSGHGAVQLTGIDLDPESLYHANEKAKRVGMANRCRFSQQNAWELKEKNAFDVITSNGLNMYESDPDRLVALYRRFFEALKPRGTLLLSFLTPPPEKNAPTGEWDKYETPMADLLQEFAIFGDIIQATYLNFTSEAEIRQQITQAGFTVKDINYSSRGVLPILVAVKP